MTIPALDPELMLMLSLLPPNFIHYYVTDRSHTLINARKIQKQTNKQTNKQKTKKNNNMGSAVAQW